MWRRIPRLRGPENRSGRISRGKLGRHGKVDWRRKIDDGEPKGGGFNGVDSGRSPESPHWRERGIGIEFDVQAVRFKSRGPRQPILDFEPGDTAKLAGVVRYQRETGGACVGGYEQVIRTDGRAFSLQVIADFRVMPFDR